MHRYKAKESLVILLKFKLLAVVTGVVFENLFKDGEDWNKAEETSKFEEVDKEDLKMLRKTFVELVNIYAYLREKRGIAPGIKIHLNYNQFDIVNGGSASASKREILESRH